MLINKLTKLLSLKLNKKANNLIAIIKKSDTKLKNK